MCNLNPRGTHSVQGGYGRRAGVCAFCDEDLVEVSPEIGSGVGKCANKLCPKTLELKNGFGAMLRCSKCGGHEFITHHGFWMHYLFCDFCDNDIRLASHLVKDIREAPPIKWKIADPSAKST